MSTIIRQPAKQPVYNKYKWSKITAATSLTIIVFVAVFGLYGIKYHTNDDAIIANIIAGGYGSDTLNSVYVNVIFSWLLQPLYKIYFANWYVIIQVLLMLISIRRTVYIFIDKIGTAGFLLSATMLIAFAQDIFYSFHYTKVSFILLTSGLLLIADNLGKINVKIQLGIFLAVMGSMLRWSSFYAVGGMSAAILLYQFFKLDYSGKKNAVITMAIMFGLVFGAKLVDTVAYKTNTDWNYYTEYNRARTQFSDFATLSLPEENIFSSYNISDTDYIMLKSWDFYDSEKFTPDLLSDLAAKVTKPSLKETFSSFGTNLKRMISVQTLNGIFLIVLFLCIAYIRPGSAIFPFAGVFAMFALLILYISYYVRFPLWVETGMMWTFAVFLIYCFGNFKAKPVFQTVLSALALASVIIVSLPGYKELYIGAKLYKEHIASEQHYFTLMSEDKDNIYLISTISTNNTAGMDVLNPRSDNFYSNIVTFGGWLSGAPHRKQALENYGLKRAIVDGVDKPYVFYDYHNIENVCRYARQELNKPVYILNTGDIPYAPYQLTTNPDI